MLVAAFIATIFIPMFFTWFAGSTASRVALEHAHDAEQEAQDAPELPTPPMPQQ